MEIRWRDNKLSEEYRNIYRKLLVYGPFAIAIPIALLGIVHGYYGSDLVQDPLIGFSVAIFGGLHFFFLMRYNIKRIPERVGFAIDGLHITYIDHEATVPWSNVDRLETIRGYPNDRLILFNQKKHTPYGNAINRIPVDKRLAFRILEERNRQEFKL